MYTLPRDPRVCQTLRPSNFFALVRCRVGVFLIIAVCGLSLAMMSVNPITSISGTPHPAYIADDPTPTPTLPPPGGCGGGVTMPCGH